MSMNLFLKQLNLYLTKPVPTDVFKELKLVNYVSIFLVPKLVNTNTITRLLAVSDRLLHIRTDN